jgi:hypothetical protein
LRCDQRLFEAFAFALAFCGMHSHPLVKIHDCPKVGGAAIVDVHPTVQL